MWERGLKHHRDARRCQQDQSLPMWERGLKRAAGHVVVVEVESLPMWERGLKLSRDGRSGRGGGVAPHVGAWIETPVRPASPSATTAVAPHVGAWIETSA